MSKHLTKYTIHDSTEETACDNCGCPLYVGDTAFEREDEGQHVYCSPRCSEVAA